MVCRKYIGAVRNGESRSAEISLMELLNVIRRYKWLILGLPAVDAVSAALLVTFVLSRTWEASVALEVGRVGGTIAEPVVNVITRMMLPSFAKGSLNYAGIKPEELNAVSGYYGTLKVAQVKGAELIDVKLRGPSAEMSYKLIQSVISNLQKVHSEFMVASIEKNNKQLRILT